MNLIIRLRRVTLLAAGLALALAASGCIRPMNGGPGMSRSATAAPKQVRAPAAPRAGYEHAPAMEWRSHAIGRPYTPGFSLANGPTTPSCLPAAQGISGVLPVSEGLPERDVHSVGRLAIGMAGVPVATSQEIMARGDAAFVDAMRDRTSRQATTGEGCGLNVFAYVRLGLASTDAPVAVHR